ncbi:MAG: hypothetical protein QOD42_2822 [Sphingomonadales bacterium]|jgi:hypothetical protein|nr:hypothetical protein [Sphingomonadales bacterium]
MTKYKHLLSGAALVALGMLGGCGGGGGGNVVAMEPGEWEMTARVTNVQMENMPPEVREQASRAQNQSSTARNCLTVSADVIRIQNLRFTVPVPMAGPGPVPGCRIPELSMEGGRIRVQMSCDGMPAGGPMAGGAQTMSMSGEMNGTYTAGSVEVTGRGEVRMGDRRGSAEMRITGRRIGACPAPRPYIPPPVPQPVPMPDMNAIETMPTDEMGNNVM